ncbi:MAG: hypothetical protein LBN04_03790 [Oscillospiraceae bacterium]|jgi:hypothetical protein|nr:hypothetical protein [Oscillospiraceae bacterium]
MKRGFLVLLALLLCATIAQAELPSAIPEVWNLVYEANDVMTAAKLAYITHNGLGYWENSAIRTAGFYVVNQETEGNITTLDVYGVSQHYAVSSGVPVREGSGFRPARIVLSQQGNTYTLLVYQEPGDGTDLWDDMGEIFGEDTRALMIKNQDEYRRQAMLDGDAEAEKYTEYLKTGVANGAWVELLHDGSTPGAAMIVQSALPIGYPAYVGKNVRYRYEKMYSLTVEGENSFSGILTYDCIDAAGEVLIHVKFTVKDGGIEVLEGTMPDPYQ